MKYDEFKKAVDRIIEDEDTLMIHVSPDFQCDQTLGFPTSLCVCWEQGKAWLAPNDFMMSDLPDDQAQDVLNACAEYGIRNCEDAEDFNNLLRGLGQDMARFAEPEDISPEEVEADMGFMIYPM